MTIQGGDGARRGAIAIGALALVAAAACQSGSGDSPAADAGASTTPDSASDVPPGTSSGSCAAGVPFGACPLTVADLCARFCPYPTFADAVQACGPYLSLGRCGDFDTATTQGGVDRYEEFYYDHGTGALVAQAAFGLCNGQCTAGPASFVPPTCTGAPIACPGPDAAADADSGSDSDADADSDAD
jgi:hypothetical protein